MRELSRMSLSRMVRVFSCLLCFILLAACSSQPTAVKYYILSQDYLEQPEKPAYAVGERNIVVLIESVNVATFLRQPGLVMQQGNNQIYIAKSSLWADPLEDAIPKFIRSRLNHQDTPYRYMLAQEYTLPTAEAYSLSIQIDAMQAKDNGEVILAGHYTVQLPSGDGKPVLKAFYFERDLLKDGHVYAIGQIEMLLSSLAEDIVLSLADIDKRPKNERVK